jgi:hypothetical protein
MAPGALVGRRDRGKRKEAEFCAPDQVTGEANLPELSAKISTGTRLMLRLKKVQEKEEGTHAVEIEKLTPAAQS